MKAIVISAPGGPEVLRLADRGIPEVTEQDVLIEVHAAGVNRPDVSQRKGNYPPPPDAPPDIPGLEVAGVVARVGQGVKRWQAGDRVCALVSGGGYAEYAIAPEGQCLPVPEGLGFAEAASLPETYFTVWSNVFDRGQLKKGESLLVHGGSSGIGVTAIQCGRAFGAKVFVTAGTEEKCRFCEQLGADRAINYREEKFRDVILAVTGNRGVDVVLDMIGGDYTPDNIDVLADEGRLVLINFMRGSETNIRLAPIMRKRLVITGSTLRPRDRDFKRDIALKLEANIWPLLSSGDIKPVVYKTFPMANAGEAHALMESSRHIGKIVLTVR